jgi:hypothetical protein
VEKRAKRVNIGGNCGRLPGTLLRRCVHGRKPAFGHDCGNAIVRIEAEQLRNSEVEQLGFAVLVDEHVTRLDVSVDNLMSMRDIDCRTDLEKEPKPTS